MRRSLFKTSSERTDKVLFRKEKYYSPSLGKTYLAPLPVGYEGQFGPGLKALSISLYYGGNMTEGKLLEFVSDIGISISAGQLSNLVIKKQQHFHTEKTEVIRAGLESSPWQHFDQTHARVGGQNYTCNVVCNPLYTVYHTTEKKDRLTVLDAFLEGSERHYLLNQEAFELLELFRLPVKIRKVVQQFPQGVPISEDDFRERLSTKLPRLGKQQEARLLESAAIAAYHDQDCWPIIQALVCDDAPQFKLLTREIAGVLGA